MVPIEMQPVENEPKPPGTARLVGSVLTLAGHGGFFGHYAAVDLASSGGSRLLVIFFCEEAKNLRVR